MKNIFKYTFGVVLSLTLLATSCQKSSVDSSAAASMGANEGALSLTYNFANTRSTVSEVISENSTLKIYNSEGELLRRYSPISETPSDIYLLAGSYSVAVEAGDIYNVTTSTDELKYSGSAEFTITSQSRSSVNVDCTLENSAAQVSFDESIASTFDEGYFLYFSTSNDFPSTNESALSSLTTIRFDEDGMAYFYLPSGVENISWWFYGESSDTDAVVGGVTSTTGKIEEVTAGNLYTLALKYSPSADGLVSFEISVNEVIDEENISDIVVTFSPKPVIAAQGFNTVDTYTYTPNYSEESEFTFNVTAINNLKSIVIDADLESGETITLLSNGEATSTSSLASYSVIDEKSGTITLSADIFDKYSMIGDKNVQITATDIGAVSTTLEWNVYNTQGFTSAPTVDLWLNSAEFGYTVSDPTVSSATICIKGEDGDWIELTTTANDNSYSAKYEAVWSDRAYSGPISGGLAGYVLDGGIFAGNSYEYGVKFDGDEEPSSINTLQTSAGHTIPYGNMNDSSLSCFTSSNSSSTTWASGNNSFTGGLCSDGSSDGNGYAVLTSAEAFSTLATGNILYGQFAMGSGLSFTTGYASFGQAFSWESRPRKFKFSYNATIGTIDSGSAPSGSHLSTGNTDNGIVRLVIVDWSSRHTVSSGTSDPTGTWNPQTQTSVDEGAIIGYADYFVTQSSSGWVTEEVDIVYYDKVTKPSKAYTITIQAANSFYGDYKFGCESNVMHIDDFELVY